MTDSPTDVALRYVGQQLETLRTSVHDELTAMRSDVNTLATEVRSQAPTMAVLDHRVGELEKDITAVQADRAGERVERERERAADKRLRIQIVCTAGVSLLCALIAVVTTLLGG